MPAAMPAPPYRSEAGSTRPAWWSLPPFPKSHTANATPEASPIAPPFFNESRSGRLMTEMSASSM